jgi:hypothetical protein
MHESSKKEKNTYYTCTNVSKVYLWLPMQNKWINLKLWYNWNIVESGFKHS